MVEPLLNGDVGRVNSDRLRSPKLAARIPERAGEPQYADPFPPRNCTPREHTREQVCRSRQGRTAKNGSAPFAIEADELERGLGAHTIRGADRREKRQRLAITPEEHVLAVVHQLSGLSIPECGRAAAELRPRVEHQHLRTATRQGAGRAEAGETAAYDDDVVARGHGRRTVLAQVAAAMTARRGLGIRTTRENTS